MNIATNRGATIIGWGTALPDKVVTNDDLTATMDTSHEWIVERTGIHQRHIGGTTAGLAVEAGMVICIELYSTAETGQQIGNEETYVIEDTGPRRISVLPREIRVVG